MSNARSDGLLEPSPYPPGSVRDVLPTDHVSQPTRRVLEHRLAAGVKNSPEFLSPAAFATLRAVCDRLVPQDDLPERVDIAGQIDQRLANGASDGWRYAVMPPDREAWIVSLAAIDETSYSRFSQSFIDLELHQKDALLRDIQAGEVSGAAWRMLQPARAFEDILTEAVETFYASPIAQEDIGYAGMADLPGWKSIGLNQLSDREPRRRELSLD